MQLKKDKKDLTKKFNFFGDFLILLGILLLVFIFAPVAKEEVTYQTRQILNREPDLTPPNKEFSIVIPKIAAVSAIIANVDSQNKNAYLSALHRGVAHAKGTSYPGEEGNVYLFAHSTDTFYNVGRYNAVFYLIGKLEINDEIEIFYKGELIKYKVSEKKVVNADQIKYLGKIDDENTLTLQTCYPPGTDWKRLIVVAKEVTN
jgi:sortase A